MRNKIPPDGSISNARRDDIRFRSPAGSIREHIRSSSNPNDATTPVTGVKHLVGLSGPAWGKLLAKHFPGEVYRSYATSLLLFHYHLHGGAERQQIIRKRLEISLIQRRPAIQWLDPAEVPALEQSLVRYWKPRGLQLRFVDP